MKTFITPGQNLLAPSTPGVAFARDNVGTGLVGLLDAAGEFSVARVRAEFDPSRLLVWCNGSRNYICVYQAIPGKSNLYIQYRWNKVTSGTAANLWKLTDITVVSRARTQWRFTHVAQLVSGGENDVVWAESANGSNQSIDDGATVSGASGTGDAFFGGSAHGNNKPIATDLYGGSLTPKLIVDGTDLNAAFHVHAIGRRVEIIQKEELYRPRNPASSTAVITQTRRWLIDESGYKFNIAIKFNQQFTGVGYLPLICTQTRYTSMFRDSDGANIVVPTDINTLASNAISAGVRQMVLRSSDYGGVTIDYDPVRMWAASGRPNGATLVPGLDYHQIRIVGGYHKLDRIIGGSTAGSGSNPYRALINEEWEAGYKMQFNF